MALLSGLAALLVPQSAGQKSEPPRGSADAPPSRSLRIVSIVPVSMLTLSSMDPDMFFHMEAGMAEADEVLGATPESTHCALDLRAAGPVHDYVLGDLLSVTGFFDVKNADDYEIVANIPRDVADIKVVGRIDVCKDKDGNYPKSRYFGCSFENRTFMISADLNDLSLAALRGRTIAHEYGHTARLEHEKNAANLMYAHEKATDLGIVGRLITPDQCAAYQVVDAGRGPRRRPAAQNANRNGAAWIVIGTGTIGRGRRVGVRETT